MNTLVAISLVVAIPIILFPAAFVWYINLGSLMKSWKEKRIETEAVA